MSKRETLNSPRVRQALLKRALQKCPYWHVEVNGCGIHVIRDARGVDPLRHPDPMERLFNVHLAAQAPTLREATLALVRRLETMHGGWKRDDELVSLAWCAIYCCRPLDGDEAKLRGRETQGQMLFDEAA